MGGFRACGLLAALLFFSGGLLAQTTMGNGPSSDGGANEWPVRLRSPQTQSSREDRTTEHNDHRRPRVSDRGYPYLLPIQPAREPDEFERFVSQLAGDGPTGEPLKIRRLGSALQAEARQPTESGEADPLPLVPSDYVIKAGDELVLTLWGSVDAELALRVDRGGRISVPRVGTVQVAGTRFSEVQEVVRRRVAQTFKNFDLSVSMGALRGVRVFVTGFVVRPGTYLLGSLSTLSQAVLKAGGPAASGSFRRIELRRAGQAPAAWDFYDLLIRGERRNDVVLQQDDVVHVEAVGPQVGLIGSVNQPAVFELLPLETVRDVIRMAGGFSPVADTRRLTLERLQDRDRVRVIEWALPNAESRNLHSGDVLRAISTVDVSGSQMLRNKRVRIDGEVQLPGTYVLPPGSSLQDAIASAGGLTTAAFLYGTELQRDSVRRGQQENYDRALRDLETDLARAAAAQRSGSADEGAAQANRAAASARLIDRLRALRPSGRVVLELQPESTGLPQLLVEDGDRLNVPPRSTTVGVFGSVFNTGNYLFAERRTLGDYLRLAGGPTRSADGDSAFVVRANGAVISERQTSSWLSSGRLQAAVALPGDTIFVPEDLDRTTLIQGFKDWSQVLFQLGLGFSAFRVLGN